MPGAMPWVTLIPVAGLCLLGAWLTYSKAAKDAGTLYVLAFAALGASTAAMYGAAVAKCDGETSFKYCVGYDVVVLVAYYAFPLLAGRVQPDGRSLLAAVLVIALAWLLKGGE